MRNFRSDYYTHYESLLPNLFPEIEIYLYDAYKNVLSNIDDDKDKLEVYLNNQIIPKS